MLGCGNIGQKVLRALLLASRTSAGSTTAAAPTFTNFIATTARERSAAELSQKFASFAPHVRFTSGSSIDVVREADMVLLCCPPQSLRSLRQGQQGFGEALAGKAVVSFLAGVSAADVERELVEPLLSGENETRGPYIVRAMPSAAASLGESATLLDIDHATSIPAEARASVTSVLSSLGRVITVPGQLFDALTAVQAVTHGLMTVVVDALVESVASAGLPRTTLVDLVGQSLKGYGALLLDGGENANADIKKSLSSPEGFTARSIRELETRGVRAEVAQTLLKIAGELKAGK